MQPADPKRNVYIAIAVIGVVFLAAVTLLLRPHKAPEQPSTTQKAQEAQQKPKPEPADASVDTAIAHMQTNGQSGMSDDQGNATKNAFIQYAKKVGTTVDKVTITTASIQGHAPNVSGDVPTFSFTVKVNGQSYGAQLLLITGGSVQLLLFDASSKQIYDSGIVQTNSVY